MPEDQNGQDEVSDQVQIEESQGEEQPEELSTSESSAEEPQGELPEDAREKTKREFEKLKEHNKQLAEENKKLKGQSQPIPSVLDYLEPANMAQTQVPQYQPQYQNQPSPQTPEPEQLVDENGYVNTDVLRRELNEAKQARKEAEQAREEARSAASRISKYEQDSETQKLYEAYPELNPLSGELFNEEAYRLVRNELTSQIVSTGKRDAMKAASDMSKYFRTQAPANQKVIEQRNAVRTPGTTQRPPSTDLEALKLRSRTDPNAMLERLERSGY